MRGAMAKKGRKAAKKGKGPPSPSGELFRCKRCGACCSMHDLPREQISRDENGVFYAIRPGENAFEVWPWEAERLRAAAEERETVMAIRPCMFIIDGKELGRAIVLTYHIRHKECPFLDGDGKGCTIYGKRPRTCRMFPLFGHRSGIGISQVCPFLVPMELTADEVRNGVMIQAAYREEVEHVFKDMHVFKSVFGLVRDMEANGVIAWDKEAPGATAAKLLKERGIDLLDLLRYEGVMTDDELKKAIETLESMDGVREHLELRIKRSDVLS